MNADIRLAGAAVLVAAWFGAALLAAASVAPSAFAVLPSRTLAGDLVGRVLPVVFTGGIAVGIAAALLAGGGTRLRATLGVPVALTCGLACALAQFIVGPRVTRLRAAIGPALDALSPDDPRRIAFGRLHAASVGGLGVALLAAAAFVVLSLLALRKRA
jgi:hypothetical protein